MSLTCLKEHLSDSWKCIGEDGSLEGVCFRKTSVFHVCSMTVSAR